MTLFLGFVKFSKRGFSAYGTCYLNWFETYKTNRRPYCVFYKVKMLPDKLQKHNLVKDTRSSGLLRFGADPRSMFSAHLTQARLKLHVSSMFGDVCTFIVFMYYKHIMKSVWMCRASYVQPTRAHHKSYNSKTS